LVLRNIPIKVMMSALVAMSVMLGGCGGESTTERKAKDGRILVWNDLGNPIRTSYLDEELGQVDTMIDPGETEETTRRSIKGGTIVKVTVEVPGSTWRPLEVDVKVDGNVTMRIYTATAWGSGELGYEFR